MVATKTDQKSTAMDYFAAPRSEGLVVAILNLLGFTAGEGGRLPAGVKYDTLVGLNNLLGSEFGSEFKDILGGEIASLQSNRRSSAPRITASPKSIMDAVKSGKLSLDELKKAIEDAEKG
jgi:hypothetical protein